MTTKYDVGDTVLLECKVTKIVIDNKGVIYSVNSPILGYPITCREADIYDENKT